MVAVPGFISISDLPEEDRAEAALGVYLNLPAIEAHQDVRWLMAAGALFAGEKSKRYVEHLQDVAWEDEPRAAEVAKWAFAAGDASRGVLSPTPERK